MKVVKSQEVFIRYQIRMKNCSSMQIMTPYLKSNIFAKNSNKNNLESKKSVYSNENVIEML